MPSAQPPITPTEIDDPEIMEIDAERRDQERACPAHAGREHRLARPAFLDPAAEYGGGKAEENHRDREYPTEVGELPVRRRRLRDAQQPGHRQVEYAEGVGLSDAKMHAQRRRWHHPAAIAGPGDGMLAVEKRQRGS